MSKAQDLELVFAAIPTSGLKSLGRALGSGRVLRGRFIDGRGNGCLFHWLSEKVMIDRPSRVAWMSQNLLFTESHDAAMRRIIAGWDAADPESIVKGAGYDVEYPTPSYVVRASDVRRALFKVMQERRRANGCERRNRRRVVAGV